MNSKLASRLLLALVVAGLLPACGNINDGHPPVPFTILASVSTAGALSNQIVESVAISADGRYVVFESTATTLVSQNTNGIKNIFRRDLATGVTELVSIGVAGVPTDDESENPSISGDGRWVAFESVATNLTAVAPGGRQVYRRDMNAAPGTGTVMVSEVSPGTPGNGISEQPSISADGRFVAFASLATNFGDTHANGVRNIYRRDMNGATIIPVSVNLSQGDPTPGIAFNLGSRSPSISADGSRVAYQSDCSDLVALDINEIDDVFVATIGVTIDTMLASPGTNGWGGAGFSSRPSLSGDGLFVAYYSEAPDLVATDTNGPAKDVFVFDVDGGTTTLVSMNSAGFQGSVAEASENPSISSDGRYVAFQSTVSNLVDGDTNQSSDVFVKDLQTGQITRVSVDTSGNQGVLNENSAFPSLSGDGRTVAFISNAPFAKGDLNGLNDVYVRTPLR